MKTIGQKHIANILPVGRAFAVFQDVFEMELCVLNLWESLRQNLPAVSPFTRGLWPPFSAMESADKRSMSEYIRNRSV